MRGTVPAPRSAMHDDSVPADRSEITAAALLLSATMALLTLSTLVTLTLLALTLAGCWSGFSFLEKMLSFSAAEFAVSFLSIGIRLRFLFSSFGLGRVSLPSRQLDFA